MNPSAKAAFRIFVTFMAFVTAPVILRLFGGNNTISNSLIALLLLVTTWLLYRKEGKNLSELGMTITRGNTFTFLAGTFFGMALFLILFSAQFLHNDLSLTLNQTADPLLIIQGFVVLMAGVLVEELIFRGYCFNKAVELSGIPKANFVFAFLFVAWHWIAFNAWNDHAQMISLTITGFGHLLFASAFLKSGTLYYPIGIHLGYNWMSRYVFSIRTAGIVDTKHSNDAVFFVTSQTDFSMLHSIISYSMTATCFLIFTSLIWYRRSAQ